MDFARRQLEKYGWSSGKGLGKHENGISEALKPKLKRSVTGIGHDAAAEFNEHWWSALYDKAAKNIEIEDKNGKTKKIKTVDGDDFTITNSTWRINKKHKHNNDDSEYSEYFVKKAILTNKETKVEISSDSESENEVEDKKNVFKMTDEELFAVCEGRTAHKGARHGLKALGKLARIAQQEQLLLTQNKYAGYSHAKKLQQKHEEVVENISLEDKEESRKKKKKKKNRCNSNNQSDENINYEQSEQTKLELPLPNNVENLQCSDGDDTIYNDDGRKSKITNKLDNIDEKRIFSNDNLKKSKKKRKRNLELSESEKVNDAQDIEHPTDLDVPKKKKKKSRILE